MVTLDFFCSEAKELRRYISVLRRQAPCQDAKPWPVRSARNLETSAKLSLSCRIDLAKLSACLRSYSAGVGKLNMVRIAVRQSMPGLAPNPVQTKQTNKRDRRMRKSP